MDFDRANGYSTPHWKAVADSSSFVKESLNVPARSLNIAWGNDSRYWEWTVLKEDERRLIKFEEAAVLVQVNWLEVTGRIDTKPLKADQSYTIYYVVKFRVDAFGWHSSPIKFKVRVDHREEKACQSVAILESYRVRHDEWHEIPGGEFTVPRDKDDATVEFGMFEVDSDWWKGSMVLAGAKIVPKSR